MMYSTLHLVKKYLSYYLHASNGKGHGIHSPFVFDFVQHVLNDTNIYPAYSKVEALRKQLLRNTSMLHIHDMGAGATASNHKKERVSYIAGHVIKSRKYAQLLFRIARYYQPGTILEMGTSLGVTTSYLALANPRGSVITLEGSEQVAALAEQNFAALSISNVQMVIGNFHTTLPDTLQRNNRADLAFIDGNHALEPTLAYFHALLEKINPLSIIIFDDIHWSKEMEDAWEIIKTHPSVKVSIDLFFIGIVFFREEFKVKQHYLIRF